LVYTYRGKYYVLKNVQTGYGGVRLESYSMGSAEVRTKVCMTTFDASLTNLTTLLPQSRDIS
jgi:hypothetical protein